VGLVACGGFVFPGIIDQISHNIVAAMPQPIQNMTVIGCSVYC